MNNIDLNLITCAGFVMKTPDNKIILVKSENKYSFPKGKYEKKKDGKPKSLETLYSCALRELVEETEMYNYTFKTTKDLDRLYIEKSNILYFPAVICNYADNYIVDFKSNNEIDELHFLSLDQIKKISSDEIKNERRTIAISHLNNINDEFLNITETIIKK